MIRFDAFFRSDDGEDDAAARQGLVRESSSTNHNSGRVREYMYGDDEVSAVDGGSGRDDANDSDGMVSNHGRRWYQVPSRSVYLWKEIVIWRWWQQQGVVADARGGFIMGSKRRGLCW